MKRESLALRGGGRPGRVRLLIEEASPRRGRSGVRADEALWRGCRGSGTVGVTLGLLLGLTRGL